MHYHYRGAQEWRELDLPLTTVSEDACKMYDAAITQMMGYYNDDSIGGMEGALQRMRQADPNFVMGHVLNNWALIEAHQSTYNKYGFCEDIDRMLTLTEKIPGVTAREKMHAKAVSIFSQGDTEKAVSLWEDILVEHPCDMFAVAMTFYSYLTTGKSIQMRDSIARVLPFWQPKMPHYSYILGLYAFGMEETSLYSQAEAAAKKALSIDPWNAWSTHVLCHVHGSTGRHEENMTMMEKTQSNWEFGENLACHNFWHWGLDNIELGNYEAALSIFDDQLSQRMAKSGSLFNLTDATSLLYRLEMEGVSVGDRFEHMADLCKKHMDDYSWSFNDIHLFMAGLKCNEEGLAQKMMASIQNYIREGKGDNRDTMEVVGEPLVKAFSAYKEGDFAGAVELIKPIRYKIINIGGSHAQREVFNLFLIHAAIKSPKKEHHRLARNLLNEKKNLVANSPLTDRLITKVMEIHID